MMSEAMTAVLTVPAGLTAIGSRGDSDAWVGPGLLGLAVIVALGLATFLLWRNMNKQIKRVSFDENGGAATEGNGSADASSSRE